MLPSIYGCHFLRGYGSYWTGSHFGGQAKGRARRGSALAALGGGFCGSGHDKQCLSATVELWLSLMLETNRQIRGDLSNTCDHDQRNSKSCQVFNLSYCTNSF